MARRWIWLWMAFGVMACWMVSLGRTLANSPVHTHTAGGKGRAMKAHDEDARTKTLGGAERYQTFVSTDKPIYHPGEKVYVRGVLLNAHNHKPLPADTIATAAVQIKGSRGDILVASSVPSQDSVWGFGWEVPNGQAGGEYTVSVTYPFDGYAPSERKFDIRDYRAPRLKSQITFLRDGYGPGEKVTATLDVKRAEGGVPQGAKVNVTARVDGIEIDGGTATVDEKGLCTVSFDLPRQIPRGEGTLALVIADGGVVETAAKTIPILLQTVDLQIFPEGGDLLAGFKNRVYLQANQPNGKPADLQGQLMCKQLGVPVQVAEFKTEHEGRGRFEFAPEAGKDYFLKISSPAGIKTEYPLPKVKTAGAVIHSDSDVFAKNRPVSVRVGCTEKNYRVTLSKREVEVAADKVSSGGSGSSVHSTQFDVPANIDGVLTVTVWDEKGAPLAERLVFREPAHPLNITITSDKKTYIPGDNAELKVKATDADGKPVSTVVGITVTDDSVLEMVEKREKAPRLPVMVFLEPEVKDLADAAVYLDSTNPKAPLATDLLLGTQGWRRFAIMSLAKFVEKYGDKGRTMLAAKRNAPDVSFGAVCFEEDGALIQPRRGGLIPAPPPVVPGAVNGLRGAGVLAAAHGAGVLGAAHGAGMPAAGAPASVPKSAVGKDEEVNLDLIQAKPQQAWAAGDKAANKIVMEGKLARLNEQDFRRQRAWAPNLFVREFAHQVRADRKPNDRVDFAETLYWNAGVKTDAKTGEAQVKFGLNDSVTTFRVFADGFTGDGAVGAANVGLESVQPFYAEAKMPLEVTEGDHILLPISLVNATAENFSDVGVDVSLAGVEKLAALQKSNSAIAAGQRVRWIQPIDVNSGNELKDLTLVAKTGLFSDKVLRKLSVKSKGFPIETTFAGVLEPNKTVKHIITIPQALVPGSLSTNTSVFPTPLANLTEALERMIQDPYGCFEQTSSTSYPLTMAQQYFLSHTNVDPKLVEVSRQKLDDGYKKLVGFWCPDRGYEWFGENPGHEALTAFGLLHFTDMQKVRDVDQNMISTTRAWLLKQKDGKGGFTRKRRALHTWIEDKDCSNAYILWALLECGQPASDLSLELSSIKSAASESKNMYVVALAANALYLSGDKSAAKKLMDALAAKQKPDGSIDGITSSIVGSSGQSLTVEGTALSVLAWLHDPAYAANVEKSIKFLADSCKAGRYGSTQATVLALRAIVKYDQLRAHPKAPGKVRVAVDGNVVGDWVSFDQSSQGAIKLSDICSKLPPGEHTIELTMQNGSVMPYSVAAKYNALTPASSKDCKLDIVTKLAQDHVSEGTATEANVTVTNNSNEVVPTPIAIVGLPGGLEPRHAQLKELVKKSVIDAYEVRGREVVLYWRTLPGNAKVEVPLSLVAAIPGTYTGPASRAYLYYGDEDKKWVDGMQVEIAAAR
ncbi:MAG: A-macroglobulin complement component [Candidatus Melainabacteria bacterium]|nr:MAG: A-macroglobulin complement component [Candidatus Melainabacteria bacterium]